MDYSDQKKQSNNEGWFENLKKTIKHSTDDVKRVFSSPVTRDMLFYLFVGRVNKLLGLLNNFAH